MIKWKCKKRKVKKKKEEEIDLSRVPQYEKNMCKLMSPTPTWTH